LNIFELFAHLHLLHDQLQDEDQSDVIEYTPQNSTTMIYQFLSFFLHIPSSIFSFTLPFFRGLSETYCTTQTTLQNGDQFQILFPKHIECNVGKTFQ